MKRMIFLGLLLVLPNLVEAQNTSTRVRATWDINPSSEGVDYYWIALNSIQQEQNIYVNGPQCNIPANSCYGEFDVPNSTTTNKVEVWAHNQWGWSASGAIIEFTFGVPSIPANLRIVTPSESGVGVDAISIRRPGESSGGKPLPISRPPSKVK
jgi:hypothetical protein